VGANLARFALACANCAAADATLDCASAPVVWESESKFALACWKSNRRGLQRQRLRPPGDVRIAGCSIVVGLGLAQVGLGLLQRRRGGLNLRIRRTGRSDGRIISGLGAADRCLGRRQIGRRGAFGDLIGSSPGPLLTAPRRRDIFGLGIALLGLRQPRLRALQRAAGARELKLQGPVVQARQRLPACTGSPSLTSTPVTVPPVWKARLTVCSAATLPLPATVAVRLPRTTGAVMVLSPARFGLCH